MTPIQLSRCLQTIAPSTFFHLVADALRCQYGLSVVRMGDGEAQFSKMTENLEEPITSLDWIRTDSEGWLKRMGLYGITLRQLHERMLNAIFNSDYFGPSISGLVNPEYELAFNYMKMPNRKSKLVDNFFVNQWTLAQKTELYELANGITLVHCSAELADEFQKRFTRFRMNYVPLSSWEHTDSVYEKVLAKDTQLILLSGGPAGKYLAPLWSGKGKVVIDVGNSAPDWMPSRPR